MDGGGDPGTQAVLANPAVDSLTPIADSAVGPGGATAAQVQQALDESGLSVNGSGVRVGVLSDSFNDLGGAAADEADGALPSAANIDVIKDLASGGTDEGRAMMQIIHDIAPGASLAFYTAFDSEQDFANGILALAAAGSKVIVDDVSYFDEPFFQNGVVAQAIQTVEAEGVTYVTAAGNDASNGYQAAWTPISGTYDGTTLTDAESFGGSLVQTDHDQYRGNGLRRSVAAGMESGLRPGHLRPRDLGLQQERTVGRHGDQCVQRRAQQPVGGIRFQPKRNLLRRH